MCVFLCANASPTCAPELLAFNLAYPFVGQPSGVAAACSAGLDGVVKQVVCQPLQVAVAHKGVLGQMTKREGETERLHEHQLSPLCTIQLNCCLNPVNTHRVLMARSGANSPLLIVCSLLSYSDSRLRFCRSWKVLTLRQLILLAFSRLKKEVRHESTFIHLYLFDLFVLRFSLLQADRR